MEIEEYIKMGDLEENHWYFIAKRKFLDVVLEKYGSKNASMLDIGCGTGAVLAHMSSKNFSVSGIDMSDTALAYCRDKGFKVEKGFADQMPYPDNAFDIVFALDVLEHLDNPELAVKEVRRVLKSGGLFIATVPAHQWLWSYHDESLHHKKRYNKLNFAALLNTELQLVMISWIHLFILLPAILLRLLKNVVGNKQQGSDVKDAPRFINILMSAVYFLEINLFKIFGTLPFGLSVLGVAKKK